MNAETIKDTFYSLIFPDLPNEWDVDEAVDNLQAVDVDRCHFILNQVPVIWPVSHSLCFDYLKTVVRALDRIELTNLSVWVNMTLDQYEKNGLRAAQRFMLEVEENFLNPLRGRTGLRFSEVEGRLLPYLRGLSGRQLDLAPATLAGTDTTTVFVPHEINRCRREADNFFLYKLIVSYQWAFIDQGSFTSFPDGQVIPSLDSDADKLWLKGFLHSFTRVDLAADIYHFLETVRITAFLERELPGLMRCRSKLFATPEFSEQMTENGKGILPSLQVMLVNGKPVTPPSDILKKCRAIVQQHRALAGSVSDSVTATRKLYDLIDAEEDMYSSCVPLLFQGAMDLEAVRLARTQRVADLEQLFVDGLATKLLSRSGSPLAKADEIEETTSSTASADQQDIAIVMERQNGKAGGEDAEKTVVITLDNEEIQLDAELNEIALDIVSELGYLPSRYVASAVGMAGKGYADFATSTADVGDEIQSTVTYDEWDYRRADFRKNWVSVREKELPLIHTPFVDTTLDKYHGQILKLRSQFELMRTAERYVRRQRDGEDIDLDALVESLADTRAGLAPSERLFIRLQRDERDIAVLFLVDMSNSTQGWVSKAIKESLVLLCEALESTGDRYGIYGFSGMRRLRSDFFHIKHLEEHYDELVKQRIGSIAPREYTRMGPAIRHAISLLKGVDSRIRLLITLSDGKPEDYDDYKGEYAIEDTRHALIEAKVAGIHPFCITIDRRAHEYIDHMYGEVNYIMIDDVRKLPRKLPEIYRVLTR